MVAEHRASSLDPVDQTDQTLHCRHDLGERQRDGGRSEEREVSKRRCWVGVKNMKRDRRNAMGSCMREMKLAGSRCTNLMRTKAPLL